jgi:dTDP-4-dehydrorhamnose reductase
MKVFRVLVLGSNGMAGHLIKDYLSNKTNFELFGINEEDFFSIEDNYLIKIKAINPDIVINALRMTVDACEVDPKSAIIINSIIPKNLEMAFYASNVKIIHLSTDCVFSGGKGNYSENDIPDGRSLYSMTMRCGEIINKKDLSIRTSYIGPCLENKNEELFDWFMYQTGDVDGFEFAIWNGVTTLELAKVIEQVIINNYSGLYHIGSKNKISKLLLLTLIKNQWGKVNTSIKKVKGPKINRSLKDNRQYFSVTNYKRMFKELYNYMDGRQNIYGHYNKS